MVQADPWADDERDLQTAANDRPVDHASAEVETLRSAASSFITSVAESTSRLQADAEAFGAETLRVIEALAARVEASLTSSRELAEAAERSAREAKAAGEAMAAAAERLADELRAESSTARSEATAATRTAEEAREKAREALARAEESATSAQPAAVAPIDLLDRLEEDYRQLSALVQELYERTAALEAAVEPEVLAEPEPSLNREPAPEPQSWYETVEEEPAATDPGSADGEAAWPAEPPEDVEMKPESVGPALEGSVLIEIGPIPDFDRLLNIDGALGRLACLSSVTLADYERDEAVFRVEVGEALDAGDLAQRLSDAAGLPLRVESASSERVELRAA